MKFTKLFFIVSFSFVSWLAFAAPLNFTTPHNHSTLAKGGALGDVVTESIAFSGVISSESGDGNEVELLPDKLYLYNSGNEYSITAQNGIGTFASGVANEFAKIAFDFMQIRSPDGPDAYVSPDFFISREAVSQYSMMDHDEIYIGTTSSARRVRIRNDISTNDSFVEVRDTAQAKSSILSEDGLTITDGAESVLLDADQMVIGGDQVIASIGPADIEFSGTTSENHFTFNGYRYVESVSHFRSSNTSMASNDTLTKDFAMRDLPLEPGGDYQVECGLYFDSDAAAINAVVELRVESGGGSDHYYTIFNTNYVGLDTYASADSHTYLHAGSDPSSTVIELDGIGPGALRCDGVINIDAAAIDPVVSLYWSQQFGSATSVRSMKGSYIRFTRIFQD